MSGLEASGNKHFELAEYDAAITDFKEAFRISDEPGFLYNIAQAYRLKRDCREAATFYKTYLRRVPDAPNAAKIRDRITEMDTCAATQPVTGHVDHISFRSSGLEEMRNHLAKVGVAFTEAPIPGWE